MIKVSAIHIDSHSLLCSSSTDEPSDPPFRMVHIAHDKHKGQSSVDCISIRFESVVVVRLSSACNRPHARLTIRECSHEQYARLFQQWTSHIWDFQGSFSHSSTFYDPSVQLLVKNNEGWCGPSITKTTISHLTHAHSRFVTSSSSKAKTRMTLDFSITNNNCTKQIIIKRLHPILAAEKLGLLRTPDGTSNQARAKQANSTADSNLQLKEQMTYLRHYGLPHRVKHPLVFKYSFDKHYHLSADCTDFP